MSTTMPDSFHTPVVDSLEEEEEKEEEEEEGEIIYKQIILYRSIPFRVYPEVGVMDKKRQLGKESSNDELSRLIIPPKRLKIRHLTVFIL